MSQLDIITISITRAEAEWFLKHTRIGTYTADSDVAAQFAYMPDSHLGQIVAKVKEGLERIG